MAGNSADPGRSVTEKVTSVIKAFTDVTVLRLSEIADIAGLPTSTAHRLASELSAWRLLERTEDGRYQVGLPLRMLGAGTTRMDVHDRATLMVRAQPLLTDLARSTSARVRLGVLSGREVVILAQCQSPQHPAGSIPDAGDGSLMTVPASTTAIGKALLAFSPAAVVDEVIDGSRWLPDSIAPTAPRYLRRTLSKIRITRLATCTDADSAGVAIAMPVFSSGGNLAAAIELACADTGGARELATGALTVACRSLSRQLATELSTMPSRHTNYDSVTPA